MPLDLATISPEARRRYIRIGRRYKTPSVLAQADQTARALEQHGPVVALHGFGTEEQGQLLEGRDMLWVRQHDSTQAEAQRSIASQNYEAALEDGKQARQTARATLTSVDTSATEKGASDVTTLVRTALKQTSHLAEDRLLVDQLSTLHTAVIAPLVVPFMLTRGGVELALRLETTRDNLRIALSARAGHAPVTSVAEEREILDGMLVTLARSARDAAKAAARHTGQPSIAAAFKLTHLRRSGTSPAAAEPESPPAGGNDDAPVTEPGTPTPSGK